MKHYEEKKNPKRPKNFSGCQVLKSAMKYHLDYNKLFVRLKP